MNRIEKLIAGAAVSTAFALASGPYLPPRPHPERGTVSKAAATTSKKPKEQPNSAVPRAVDRVDVVVTDKPSTAAKKPSEPAKK